METRANYVAVGSFVLLIILGLVVSTLWLAGRQFHEEYNYYLTRFSGAVTGLGTGTIVRYNGIDVGRVRTLDFDPDDPRLVVATLEVRPGLKLHEDSVVSIESQGLTGGSYVEIHGGTPQTPLLPATQNPPYTLLRSKPSTLQQVFDSTPELLARLTVISDRLGDLLSEQNRQSIADTLANLRDATAPFGRHQADIDTMITDGAATMHNLTSATKALDASLGELQTVLAKASTTGDQLTVTLSSAGDTAKKLTQLTGDLDDIVANAKPELREFAGTGLAQLTQLIGETRQLVASLTRISNAIDRDPNRLLFGDRREGYTPR